MVSAKKSPALLPAALAACLAYLALDFLIHASILAQWWSATEAYWLPPLELFQRIPFAYLSFAIYSTVLVWLLVRFLGPKPGLRESLGFGAAAGGLFGIASVLAQYSVFPMPASGLLVFPASVIIGSLGASAAGASVLSSPRPWRQAIMVLLIAFAIVVLGVLLQNP